MILTYLGSKGEIEEKSKNHRYHSSLLITHKRFKLLIDYGEIHKYKLNKIKPNVILITHAHPDHAFGLKEGTNIPVYSTRESYKSIKKFPVKNFRIIKINKKFQLNGFEIIAYKVIHSIRCPAVCYKIKVGKKIIVYAPDLIDIIKKGNVLKNVDFYIGDGSIFSRSLIRRKGKKLFGHSSIKTQINWCKKFGIKKIFFTHFGKEIIKNEKEIKSKVKEIAENVEFAYDGLKAFL